MCTPPSAPPVRHLCPTNASVILFHRFAACRRLRPDCAPTPSSFAFLLTFIVSIPLSSLGTHIALAAGVAQKIEIRVARFVPLSDRRILKGQPKVFCVQHVSRRLQTARQGCSSAHSLATGAIGPRGSSVADSLTLCGVCCSRTLLLAPLPSTPRLVPLSFVFASWHLIVACALRLTRVCSIP